jgi:hypothetical protein
MAQFGARYVGSLNANQEQVFKTLPVANGVTVTAGDFVYLTSGRVSSASPAGIRLLGVAQSTVTGNSGGTNTVLVDVTPSALYAVDNDNVGTTYAASHVGTYFDIVGATGAQLADTSTTSGSSGQLMAWEYSPSSPYTYGDTDHSVGIFSISENARSI